MVEFRMPSLGADMEHGKVVEWMVKPGDYVHKGDLVATVDTDKTVMDIESFEEGVVAEFLVDVGDTVNVGTPIARITPTPAEQNPPPLASATAAAPAGKPRPAPGATAEPEASSSPPAKHGSRVLPPVRHLARSLGIDMGSVHGSGPYGTVTRADVARAARTRIGLEQPDDSGVHGGSTGQRRKQSSPRARRVAAQLDVELQDVAGTGPNGAITESDVRRAADAAAGKPEPAKAVMFENALDSLPAVDGVPPSREESSGDKTSTIRQAIGSLMSRSKKEIPHYYLGHTLDLAAAMAWMQSQNQQRPVSARLVPSALLLKATALAAMETPEINGFFTHGTFRPSATVHLGVAVALRHGGLMAPALHDAQLLTLDELMSQLRGVVGRTRAGRLQRAEMADPTITVTNLGDLGVESVYGVIYPPQVAMVGFGRIREQAWAHNGMLGIRHIVTATLSADHRVSDGLRGGRFLARIDELLQKPEDL